MARIFFNQLEKRKSTQTLLTLSALPGLTGLEQTLASSIGTQTRGLSQLFSPLYPYGTFYSPVSPYSSYFTPWSPFGSYYSPWTTPYSTWSSPFASLISPWSSWTSPWSSWTSPWSSWISPWSTWTTPWTSSTGLWPSTTSPSTIPGSSTPYPPGPLYGLVKRSNLKA